LHIHQDKIEGPIGRQPGAGEFGTSLVGVVEQLKFFQGLSTVIGDCDAVPLPLQDVYYQHLVGCIVLSQEDAQRGGLLVTD
jgi:hypothetical protein